MPPISTLTTDTVDCTHDPISATHSIIGGLVAVGLASKEPKSLGLASLGKTCAAWVASCTATRR